MKVSTLVCVETDIEAQETIMPLRQATHAQVDSIRRAINRLGERGDAGRSLQRYLTEQLDAENADQSVRCALKNLEGAIREMRNEFRSIMH
jgi:hypothetical protein